MAGIDTSTTGRGGADNANATCEPRAAGASSRSRARASTCRRDLIRTWRDLIRTWPYAHRCGYYVLREAELLGQSACLGPVGGRIVAEVLIGLLAGDPLSYLNVQPTWQPQAPFVNEAGEFGMPELIKFAVPTAMA